MSFKKPNLPLISAILVFVLSISLRAQSDSALQGVREMKSEIENYLNQSSDISQHEKITLSKTVYDSIINLVHSQRAELDAMALRVKIIQKESEGFAHSSDDSYIFFASNSSVITEIEKNKIRRYVQAQPKDKHYNLSGYADLTGTKEENMGLSRARSEAVKQFMVDELKLNALNITVQYFGNESPLCTTTDETCNARNRRVAIK